MLPHPYPWEVPFVPGKAGPCVLLNTSSHSHASHFSTNMPSLTLPMLSRPPRPVPTGGALCVGAGWCGLHPAGGRGSYRLGGWRSGGVHRPRHLCGVHSGTRRQGGQGAGKCGAGRRHRWHHSGKAARLSVMQNMGRVVRHPPCRLAGSFKQHRHQAIRCCKKLAASSSCVLHAHASSKWPTHTCCIYILRTP